MAVDIDFVKITPKANEEVIIVGHGPVDAVDNQQLGTRQRGPRQEGFEANIGKDPQHKGQEHGHRILRFDQ